MLARRKQLNVQMRSALMHYLTFYLGNRVESFEYFVFITWNMAKSYERL